MPEGLFCWLWKKLLAGECRGSFINLSRIRELIDKRKTPSIRKMVKLTLKILHYLLRDLKRQCDHFLDTRHYGVENLGFCFINLFRPMFFFCTPWKSYVSFDVFRGYWRRSDVFIVNLEPILLIVLTLKNISESCIEIKIELNFYFHTSLWCLKRFYEGLKGFHKILSGTTKKCENKNLA